MEALAELQQCIEQQAVQTVVITFTDAEKSPMPVARGAHGKSLHVARETGALQYEA